MAQGDATVRNRMKKLMAEILASDSLKIALCSGAQPSIDGAIGLADVTQITADNYTAGGKTLTGAVVTQDDTLDRGKFDADDVEWTALGAPGATLTYAAMYDDTLSGDPVMMMWELTTQPNGGNYKLAWNAAGVIYVAT